MPQYRLSGVLTVTGATCSSAQIATVAAGTSVTLDELVIWARPGEVGVTAETGSCQVMIQTGTVQLFTFGDAVTANSIANTMTSANVGTSTGSEGVSYPPGYSYYVGTVVVATGGNIHIVAAATSNFGSNEWTVGVFSRPSASGSSGITDVNVVSSVPLPVNVVAIDTLDNPVWVSTVSPAAPVINEPVTTSGTQIILDNRVLEGSFNPYGNGQPSNPVVRERDRQVPHSDLTVDLTEFTQLLGDACRQLPTASCNFAQNIVSPDDYPLGGHPGGYKAEEAREEKDNWNKNSLEGAQRKIGGAGVKSRSDPGVKADVVARNKTDLARNLNNVVRRVSSKMKNWHDVLVWLTHGDRPDLILAERLVDACKRLNLDGHNGADYFASCQVAEGRRDQDILIGYGTYGRALNNLQQSELYQKWVSYRFATSSPLRVLTKSDAILAAGRGVDDICKERCHDEPIVFADAVETLIIDEDIDRRGEVLEGSFNPYGNCQWTRLLGETVNEDKILEGSFNPYGNGQPGPMFEFPDSMDHIEQGNVTVSGLIESSGTVSGPLNDPINDVIEQTGLMNIQGITMSSVPREIHIRGGTISAANTISTTNTLNSPEALLYPTTVRSGFVGPLQDNTARPGVYGVGLVRRKALYPSVLSAAGLSLQELLGRAGNIRPDQITESGFLTSDSAMLTRVQPDSNGDSIVSLLVKSYLYEKSRCWLNDVSQLPVGCEPGKFDSYTQLAVNPVITLGYNTGTVYGSDCLPGIGANYVFPYVGGVAPQIAFHVCKSTIPDNEPWYMIRPGMLLQNDAGSNNSINIALLAMLLAPYPCGIHTVSMTTTSVPGGNEGLQTFIPNSDLVHIPGVNSTIHIYIPNSYPAGPPQSQASANAQVLVIPTSGPTASPTIAASVNLNISYVGTVIRYNLADYLYTWMSLPNSPIDLTTLARFRRNICELVSRSADVPFAWELSCVLSARYPAMVSSANAVVQFPASSDAAMAVQNWMGLKPTLMTVDYPEQFDTYDLYLPDMNPMWWCKINSGVYTANPDSGTQPPPVRCYDGSPRLLQYTIHAAREYALTSEYLFTYMQQSCEVWNAAFNQLNYVNILAQIRSFFTEARSSGGDAMVSDSGYALALLHSRVNMNRPCGDMFDHTLWDYINTPRAGFLPVFNFDGTELILCTPCVLPDIWVQLNMAPKNLCFTPLLSTNKFLTGVEIPNGQVTPIGGGSYLSPMTIAAQPRAIGLNSIPELDDRTVFNNRLTWHAFTASLYLLDGTIVAAGVPSSGHVVCQKSVWPDWTVTNLVTPSILTANTRWIPYMDVNGLRIAPGVTAGNNANLMTQVMAKRITTGVSTWMLRGVKVMPNTIVTSGGGNTVSRIARRPGMGNASTSSGLASEDGGESGY